MIQDGRPHGTQDPDPPPTEWSGAPGRPLAARLKAVPRGPALAGLAVAAAAGAVALLLLGRGRVPALPVRARHATLAAKTPARKHERREARVRGFWAGVLASAGSAIASTLARRLAEDLLENARARRAAEEPARG